MDCLVSKLHRVVFNRNTRTFSKRKKQLARNSERIRIGGEEVVWLIV